MQTSAQLTRIEKIDKSIQGFYNLAKIVISLFAILYGVRFLYQLFLFLRLMYTVGTSMNFLEWLLTQKQLLVPLGIIAAVAIIGYFIHKGIYLIIGPRVRREKARRKSAEVLTDTSIIPMVRQVNGPQRSGKDASVTGSANIMREHMMISDAQKMADIRDKCYMIDFDKVHDFLDKLYNGKKFVQSNPDRVKKAFISALRQNESFLYDEHIVSFDSKASEDSMGKGLTPGTKMLYDFVHNHEEEETYLEGLTPGGKRYFDFLYEYFIYYVRYVHIPNYILSNQPIIEELKLDKNQKVMDLVMSKKFRQSMTAIKEDNSFPFIHSMIIIETETAIFHGNTDKKHENYIKQTSGIREFLTLIGHLLGESCFEYFITQDENRPVKAIRELAQVYMEVRGRTVHCTSPRLRSMLEIYINILKWFREQILSIEEYSEYEVRVIKKWISNFISLPFKLLKLLFSQLWKIDRVMDGSKRAKYNLRKRVSRVRALQDRLFNRGYIEFNYGVYYSIREIGASVTYPEDFVDVIKENHGENFEKRRFGMKLTVRISDTWERYDTHFLKIISTAKKEKHSETFLDIPSWSSMRLAQKDIYDLGYGQLIDVMDVLTEPAIVFENEEARKQRNLEILTELSVKNPKRFNTMIEQAGLMKGTKVIAKEKDTRQKRIPKRDPEVLLNLDHKELLQLVIDRGLIIKAALNMGPIQNMSTLELIDMMSNPSKYSTVHLRRILVTQPL